MNNSAGYITGTIMGGPGEIPIVSHEMSMKDYLGTLRVRCSIGRNRYRVSPGLYAHGEPVPQSPVMVTANYKLSFDHLRRNLKGINCWILVLDTRGINVWCAAGKGTFGTTELVNRIQQCRLHEVVDHRNLIVPQLGATGIAAYEVRKLSGFRVIFGPVRAADIPEFVEHQYHATPEMRRVRFNLPERLVLIPGEIKEHFYYLVFIMAAFFLLGGLYNHGYSVDRAFEYGLRASFMILFAYLSGGVITPIIFPLIPFRHFFMKGAVTGILTALVLYFFMPADNVLDKITYFLLIPAISSFKTMNYTGTSTFTSLSGVLKEMKIAVPVQLTAASAGLILWIIARFLQ